ncbi:GyrI-like domain-containing protein [Aureisphaera galaxeae]|uniref:GyrI-like domain-containing protein n=1 Tax=Aureisphaera galaxeae TaxID=1538023 RepID=UPI0023510367|nr:GyrI-like domain-containing protein [Aureisphaera galaxeae]MDC8002998.1 GyrI-like domain-containing protein [Aureisphaera galaxeae]
MVKKALLTFLGLAVLAVLWYLFIKSYDYQVNFKAETTVGTVNQSIKSWNSSLKNHEPIVQKSLGELVQTIKKGDTVRTYVWNIKKVGDNEVKVSAGIIDAENGLRYRTQIPFGESKFEKESKEQVQEFFQKLNEHLKEIRVTIEGESDTQASFCAYIPLKGIQIEKARGMMSTYNTLTGFMIQANLEPRGTPFVEVERWDQENDSIIYNFCFPIVRSENLPEHPEIRYKRIFSKKALKATYNGNYITSDRAWYALEEYAEANNIEVDLTPLEVFYNNPNMGGDELNWKAEIFLPIKE